MGDISTHFNRAEFKCQCGKCDWDTVDKELLEVLEDVRTYFNKPVTITSGNRCPDHNAFVGGASQSYHIRGRAADIKVKDIHPSQVHEYLINKHPNKYGFGNYDSFTHIDTRTGKGRWNG